MEAVTTASDPVQEFGIASAEDEVDVKT